jgi:hypothetical protein
MSLLLIQNADANDNRFLLASQFDFGAHKGFIIDLECHADGDALCRLANLKLFCGMGIGSTNKYLGFSESLQYNKDYSITAEFGPDGMHARLMDSKGNILEEKSEQGVMSPMDGDLSYRQLPDWAKGMADYQIAETALSLESPGEKPLNVRFPTTGDISPALFLFTSPTGLTASWHMAVNTTVTVKTSFRILPAPDIKKYLPLIDRYGQVRQAEWPEKVHTDADMRRDAMDESTRLKDWGAPAGFDPYGGWKKAGWKEKPTGFYRVLHKNGKWRMVTPEGYPCFYLGVCTAPAINWDKTPVTGREDIFAELPSRTASYSAEAWGKNSWGDVQDTDYCAFQAANIERRYGNDWMKKEMALTIKRIKDWGFCGLGKWCNPIKGLPSTPVLSRGQVPNLVRHPDIFDPTIQKKFTEVLRRQIEPQKKNPWIVGWTVGSEYDEIVTSDEMKQILAKAVDTPSRKAILSWSVETLHKGSVEEAAKSLGVQAATLEELQASKLNPTPAEQESLREFYEDSYYNFIYKTVKKIDPNHLYLGCWIVPGWWENESDWMTISRHCDVIGYDRYNPHFSDDMLTRLMKEADKPILAGEFSFPPVYDGLRGFGVYPTWANNDADAGRLYAQWMKDAVASPYCVGCNWFQYRDEPVTGRGPGNGPNPVYGEDYAFGLVTVTDHPKWTLLTAIRASNLASRRAAAK